jgi:hypothetical protein
MSETPTPGADPVTPPPPAPASPTRSRSLINQAFIDELTQAEQVAATAALPEYAPALADEEIDAAFVNDFRAKVAAADALVGGAAGKSADRKVASQREDEAKEALLAELQKVQTRAKRKYKDTADPMREKYFIGERLGNRAMIERVTRAVLATVADDRLPGQKTEGTAALAAALETYVKAQTGHTSDQAGATSERAALEAKVKEVADLRREIQYAADLLWPADKKTHAGIRKAFGLPVNKALR